MSPVPVPPSTSPADLGFTRRTRMVSWYDPRALIGIAIRDGIAAVFGTYADKRDQQAVLPTPADPGFGTRDELWFDMVGDMGEAFDPTYAVAWHLAQPSLSFLGAGELPRGDLLVLMGDEVYPTGSIDRYENQMVGPYDAAMPVGHVPDDGPIMLALPGNHDWYDGLTAFIRVFCQRRSIGGYRTQQTRSYFSVPLPHGWWIWAIDTQLGGWLDAPQLAYFTEQAKLMQPGDQIILVTPVPFWLHSQTDQTATATVGWFLHKVVRSDVSVRLFATGDWHHYAHYETPDGVEHRLTVGGGGAFLHPTHNLKPQVIVPGFVRGTSTTLRRGVSFPARSESRSRLWLVLLQAFFNPVFSLTLGLVNFALAWLAQASVRERNVSVRDVMRPLSWRNATDALARSPLAIVLLLTIFVAWFLFPRHTEPSRRRVAHVVGALHGFAQVALAVPVMLAASHFAPGHGVRFGLAFALLCVIFGGLACATLTGVYLFLTNTFLKMHDNESFSALRLRSFKCFARMHIATDRTLTVHPIGIRRVHSGKWKLNPHAAPGEPWFSRPAGVFPELIEPAFTLAAPSSSDL
jgi:hypothetical protein